MDEAGVLLVGGRRQARRLYGEILAFCGTPHIARRSVTQWRGSSIASGVCAARSPARIGDDSPGNRTPGERRGRKATGPRCPPATPRGASCLTPRRTKIAAAEPEGRESPVARHRCSHRLAVYEAKGQRVTRSQGSVPAGRRIAPCLLHNTRTVLPSASPVLITSRAGQICLASQQGAQLAHELPNHSTLS
jgi:hypothetical protein